MIPAIRLTLAFIIFICLSLNAVLAQKKTATDWPTFGNDPGGQRYSELNQINAANVTKLTREWTYHMKPAADPAAPFAGASSLAFHSVSSLADGQTRGSRDKMLPGLELAYEEVLGRFHITEKRRANVGILVSFGYLRLGQNDSGSLAGFAGLTTDKYAPGAVLPPLAPYSGSFAAPGPLLPDVPASRATGPVAATGTVNNKLDGSLYGFNLGPFIEFPLHDRVSLTLGGGLGVVYANTTYNFRETVVVPGIVTATRSGRGEMASSF